MIAKNTALNNDSVFYVYLQYRYPLSVLLVLLLKHPL